MSVLKLPLFFTRLCGEGKRAAISKLTYIWTSLSRSYIALALSIARDQKYIAVSNELTSL